MRRLQKLLQKEIDKPHSFQQLKSNPFPYLEECNRLEIFEFIHQLEIENAELKGKVREKYPGQSFQDIMEENKINRLTKKMIELHKGSIENMEVELKDKILELESFKERNRILEGTFDELQKQMKGLQGQTVQVQRERRELEFDLKMYQQKQGKIDASEIFLNLYKDVRNILQESI